MDDLSVANVIKRERKDCDLVLCTLPDFMIFATMKEILSARKDVVDISFFDQDHFELDNLAKEKKIK